MRARRPGRHAVASLYSLSSIIGPPLMAQLFGRFSAAGAPIHVPGTAFFAAAILAMGAFVIYWAVTSERAAAAAGAVVAG